MGLGKLVAKLTKKGAKDGSSKVIEADTHEVDSAPVVLGPTEAEPIDRKILESADNITAISEPRLVLGPVSRNGSIPRTAEQTTPEAKPDSQSVPRSDQKPKTEVKHDSDIRDAKVASISSNLWDKAYDSIKDDEKQTGLVTSYEKLLSCFIQDDPKAENNLISQEDSKTRSEQFKSVMERGLERAHSSRTNKVAKAIGGGAEWISNFKDVIGLGVSTTPQAAIPWAAVSLSLEFLVRGTQAITVSEEGLEYVNSRMRWYCSLLEHLLESRTSFRDASQTLEDQIFKIYKEILIYQMKTICAYYRFSGYLFLRGLALLDNWESDIKAIKDIEALIRKDTKIYQMERSINVQEELLLNIRAQKDLILEKDDDECLQHLRVTDPWSEIDRIEKRKDLLFLDSFQWILQTTHFKGFAEWANPKSPRTLWIRGHAGTGKTMLVIGIVRYLANTRVLQDKFPSLSFFFCQGMDNKLNSSAAVLRNLMWQLLQKQKHLFHHLRDEYKATGKDLFEESIAVFNMTRILNRMLIDETLEPIVLIVDALDECTDGGALWKVIAGSAKSPKIKWLVSSRPVSNTLPELKDYPSTSMTILDLAVDRLREPIELFISHKVKQLAQVYDYSDEDCDLVKTKLWEAEKLTFLWVALVCKKLEAVDSYETDAVLAVLAETPAGLDDLYSQEMTKIENQEKSTQERSKMILSVVAFAYRPLHLSECRFLIGLRPNVQMEKVVQKCGSFLVIQSGTIFPIHQSATDFLRKPAAIQLSIGKAHFSLSKWIIQGLNKMLRQDMLGLKHLGVTREEILAAKKPWPNPESFPLEYASVFWIDHLGDSAPNGGRFDGEMLGQVLDFLQKHCLHWIEVLALLGPDALSGSIISINKLKTQLKSMVENSTAKADLAKLVHDAYRFMMFHQNTLEEWPLQAYASALVFSPTNSLIRRLNEAEIKWIKVKPSIDEEWSANILNLEFKGQVKAVSFSSDGTLLATLGFEEIWISSMESGKLQRVIQRNLAAYDDNMVGYEQHIKFLSDNSLVVVECKPGKSVAYLWTAAGELQRTSETMACGPHAVKVALSLDGLVAFLNKKGDKITVWNAVKDTQIEIRDSDPWHMTFSTDGRLATCLTAAPYRINIWSKDGQLLQTMRGENFPSRLAFSSDDISTRLAAMVDGGMVYIYSWNGVEYERTGCFSPRTDYVYSRFGFLDGAYLVFWTMSGLLKVWDCNNFEQIHSIQAGEDGIKHLGISSRGLIATTSYIRERYGSDEYGKIVKIWDSSLFAKGDGQFDYKSKQEARVAISHDGTLVASTLKWKPGKVALRDASTGETTRTLEHHSNVIRSLEFSPDDRYLLSMDYNERQGRFNGLANIYDREADRVRNRHALKIGCKCYLAVSANSRWLAILGLDRNSNTQRIPMEIWDLELEDPTLKWKTQVPLIEPHCCLAFSPSSRLVAFSGVSSPGMFESKCRIIILDVENGEWLPQIRVDENPSAIAFYSKHPWLVWADTKSVITVWDIERRVEVQRVTAGRIDVRQLECIDSEDSEDERFTINSGQVVSEPGKDLVDLAPGSYSYRNSGWLSFNGENVLFFPKQFRPATIRDVNSRDYSLAVCLTSGSVLYFLFSADMNLFS